MLLWREGEGGRENPCPWEEAPAGLTSLAVLVGRSHAADERRRPLERRGLHVHLVVRLAHHRAEELLDDAPLDGGLGTRRAERRKG